MTDTDYSDFFGRKCGDCIKFKTKDCLFGNFTSVKSDFANCVEFAPAEKQDINLKEGLSSG